MGMGTCQGGLRAAVGSCGGGARKVLTERSKSNPIHQATECGLTLRKRDDVTMAGVE